MSLPLNHRIPWCTVRVLPSHLLPSSLDLHSRPLSGDRPSQHCPHRRSPLSSPSRLSLAPRIATRPLQRPGLAEVREQICCSHRCQSKRSPAANCDANPGFEPVASGGNGGDEQFCELPCECVSCLMHVLTYELPGYVGFDPSLGTVIVAHQGTNTSNL